MLPLLTQSPGETRIVLIREPSLLGDPGILQLRPEPLPFSQELLAISDRWTGWLHLCICAIGSEVVNRGL
jgi:hypothetical protein